ncbi:hypothetical protein ACFLWI_05945 [Chloroflexota bacterium]
MDLLSSIRYFSWGILRRFYYWLPFIVLDIPDLWEKYLIPFIRWLTGRELEMPSDATTILVILSLVWAGISTYHELRQENVKLGDKIKNKNDSAPNVEYQSVSAVLYSTFVGHPTPASTTLIMSPEYQSDDEYDYVEACYSQLIFKNNVNHPMGVESTSQATQATIEIVTLDGIVVDFWNGRWADSNWPTEYGDIPLKNKRDIEAGSPAPLDIGARILGQSVFQGHDNRTPESPISRKIINPGNYVLRIELWAANMIPKKFRFDLEIPDIPQTEDVNQIKITMID